MRNLMLDLEGLNTMRPWQVALEEYLHTRFPQMVGTGPDGAPRRRAAVPADDSTAGN
jgi:hypothetical protein